MDFSKLNTIARGGFLPTKRLVDLTKGQRYMVTNMKEVTTKYGKKVVAELENEFDVFMPNRVSETLLQDDDDFYFKLLDAANKYELFIIYNGGSSVEFSGK